MTRLAPALLLWPALAIGQQPIDLKVDRVIIEGDYAKAVVSVKNNAGRKFDAIQVSCGFLKGGKAVETGVVILQNVPAGETAYETVLTRVPSPVDEAKCRIAYTRP